MIAHIYEVTGPNPKLSVGTILAVANGPSLAPGLTVKGTREVHPMFFPLAGILMSGSFKVFSCWEDFEHAIEAESFRHPAL